MDLPASLDPPLLLRNFGDGPRPVPTVEGGRRVWVMEKKDQDRIEGEPAMPPSQEICPWVRFPSAWTWEEIGDALGVTRQAAHKKHGRL